MTRRPIDLELGHPLDLAALGSECLEIAIATRCGAESWRSLEHAPGVTASSLLRGGVMVVLPLSAILQTPGGQQRQRCPRGPQRPASTYVTRPVHADVDAAESHQEREQDGPAQDVQLESKVILKSREQAAECQIHT